MKHFVVGLLISLFGMLAATTDGVAKENPGTDSFVKQWVEGFGARDATALGKLVDNSDGTLIVLATGERYRSRDEYEIAQGAVFSGMDALTVQLKWQEFKSMEDGTVWGAICFTETVDYGDETLRFGMVQSMTLVRRQQGWRLVMLHESVTSVQDD